MRVAFCLLLTGNRQIGDSILLIFCHPLRLLHRLLPLQLRRLLRLARSIAAGGGGRGG